MTRRAKLKTMAREDLEDLAAYYEEVVGVTDDVARTSALQAAFGLPPGSAWLLSRLVAADGRLFRREALIDYLPARDRANDRDEKILEVQLVKVRKAIGADGIETVRGIGWRLTPLGRLRVKRAIDQDWAA